MPRELYLRGVQKVAYGASTTPADLYRSCRVSAGRLEVLQDYAVTGPEDRQRREAFYAGDPLPPPGPGKQADLTLIRQLQADGVRVGRVHVADVPLTDTQCELQSTRRTSPPVRTSASLTGRFTPAWLPMPVIFVVFDGRTTHGAVVWFDYNENGQLTGYRIDRDRAAVTRCQDLCNMVRSRSLPLDVFTAAAAAGAAG